MITIKNISDETLVLEQIIDTSVDGCRVVDKPPAPMRFKSGAEITLMGYEPGISHIIRPLISPQYPREYLGGSRVLQYRAILPKEFRP